MGFFVHSSSSFHMLERAPLFEQTCYGLASESDRRWRLRTAHGDNITCLIVHMFARGH